MYILERIYVVDRIRAFVAELEPDINESVEKRCLHAELLLLFALAGLFGTMFGGLPNVFI